MALNLSKLTVELLRANPERRFSARQIAEAIFEAHPAECQAKKAKSVIIETDADLIQQLVAEIGSNRPAFQRKFPQVKTTEGRPRLFYWTEKPDSLEVAEAEQTSPIPVSASATTPLREADLYPLLSQFLLSEHGVYSKRIDEKRASNRQGPGGNKWLYPDIVGMEDLTADWHPEIKGAVSEYADQKVKLWSFEVKLLLNRSNVREVFFQAVSNSSWANLGYLAVAEIEGTETMKELRMLFSLHGIGLIQITPQNPAESQILIPARERASVDWANCNRLAKENKDFLEFVKLVRQFHQTGDPRVRDWDAVPVATD